MAIAAVLALGSTPGLAQQDASSLELPQAAQTASQTSPSVTAPVTVSPPLLDPPPPANVPAPALVLPVTPAAPSAERAAPVERPAQRAAARPAPAAETSVAAPAQPAASPAPPVEPVMAPAPQAALSDAPAPAEPAAPAEPLADDDQPAGIEVSLVALLAALGIGTAGLLAMRARRRQRRGTEAAYVAPVVAPVVATPPAEPARFPEGLRHPVMTPAAEASPRPERTVSAGDARQALIERMVAADPDEENPFTSAKSRRKRARLILQQREAGQRDTQARPFDWRAYKPSERKVDEPVA